MTTATLDLNYNRQIKRWDRNNQAATLDLIDRIAEVPWTLATWVDRHRNTTALDTQGSLGLWIRSKRIELSIDLQPMMYVGRSKSYNEFFDGIDLSAFSAKQYGVSRHHMVLAFDQGNLYLLDNNSTNGTFLNGARLLPHQPYRVRDLDKVRLGRFECMLRVA